MSLVEEDGRTEYDAAQEAGVRIATLAQEIHTVAPGGIPFLVVPTDCHAQSLEAYLPQPQRLQAAPTFLDVASFIAYVERFKVDDTLIFADRQSATLKAELDYHGPAAPTFRDHTALLTLKLSEEWQAWKGADRRWFGQVELAELLEDRAVDIVEPDSATILEAVSKLKLAKAVNFEKAIDLTNGGVNLVYSENVSEKGQMKLPTEFRLALRPYEHCDPVAVRVRLRYRLDEGKVKFQYRLDRPDLLIEAAFRAVVEQVSAGTGLLTLHGAAK